MPRTANRHRKAALLAAILFVIGPTFWFIPPMVARIVHPDLHAVFPNLKNPSEAAFVVAGVDNMPAGMLGLLISGIFGATMSHMDIGLNKNAGFFVKNFYQVLIRPQAHEKEMLLVGKIVTFLFGILVIASALAFSTWKIGLFNLMLQFGALIALPSCVPLIWGTLIKRAPAWSGWTTVMVGFATSLAAKIFLTPAWLENVMGWPANSLSAREADDWVLLLGRVAQHRRLLSLVPGHVLVRPIATGAGSGADARNSLNKCGRRWISTKRRAPATMRSNIAPWA